MIGKGTYERLKLAVEKDASIICKATQIKSAEGRTQAYLESLGLRASDLKKLEVWGFSRRGYLPLRSGFQKRWVLVADDGGENAET